VVRWVLAWEGEESELLRLSSGPPAVLLPVCHQLLHVLPLASPALLLMPPMDQQHYQVN
jgi:hypothetical protein